MREIYEQEAQQIIFAMKDTEDVSSYTLVNNWGVRFTKKGVKHDLRRWCNMYGADLGWGLDGKFGLTFGQAIDYIIDL